jgi:hypothetical protein
MTGDDFEKKIKRYHYRLELLRSIAPVIIITLQCVILYKIFGG